MPIRIHHLYISPAHIYVGHHGKPSGKTPMVEVEELECLAGKGIRGDRYFDFKPNFKGQITFFDHDVYQDLCDRFHVHDKDPSVFRRNVIVSGTDLNELIGQEFTVQGLRFLGTQESAPCYWMNEAFCEGAEEALKGNGGLRAKILTDGILTTGPG